MALRDFDFDPGSLRMRWLLDTLGGLWQLLRLGVLTRFRFRGDYWQWRLATAFGTNRTATRAELIRSVGSGCDLADEDCPLGAAGPRVLLIAEN